MNDFPFKIDSIKLYIIIVVIKVNTGGFFKICLSAIIPNTVKSIIFAVWHGACGSVSLMRGHFGCGE